MKEIKIVKRGGGFTVIGEGAGVWGVSRSLNEAIGEMLRANAEHFGLKFVWDIEDFETKKFLDSKKRRRRKRSRTVKLNPKKGC